VITSLIIKLLDLYSLIIVIYCVLTWFPVSQTGAIAELRDLLARICEPVLAPFRKLLPAIGGVMDVSPILALVVIQLLERIVAWLL